MSSEHSTQSTPIRPIGFVIREATEDDNPQIVEFLRKFFLGNDPLTKYLGWGKDDKRHKRFEKFAYSEIEDPTLVAELDGNLVGVCLNGVLERNPKKEEVVITDTETRKLFDLLDFVTKNSDPFQYFPEATKAMSVKMVSVDHKYRGKGIAKQLVTKTR